MSSSSQYKMKTDPAWDRRLWADKVTNKEDDTTTKHAKRNKKNENKTYPLTWHRSPHSSSPIKLFDKKYSTPKTTRSTSQDTKTKNTRTKHIDLPTLTIPPRDTQPNNLYN